jgi:hypothetical protein
MYVFIATGIILLRLGGGFLKAVAHREGYAMKFEKNTLSSYSKYARKLAWRFSLFLAVLIPLTACSQMKTITWREEVKLTNGQIVVVERTAKFRNVYAGGTSNGWLFQHASIKAVLPPLNKEVVWEGGLNPLALDVAKNGEIYLVATVETSQGRADYSLSHGNHVAYQYGLDGQWIRIPVETVPHEMHPNLLIDDATLFIYHGHSTSEVLALALKEKLNTENAYDERYRSWPTK